MNAIRYPWRLSAAMVMLTLAGAAGAAPLDEKDELLLLLDEQTELATRTRLNADYVPGILTVLHREEMTQRGARSVRDALNLIAGVNVILDNLGRPVVLVRGAGAAYSSGSVKVLVDGVPVNSAQTGEAIAALEIPVEQVERIEFIRGPGSAVHGEYAFAGILDIVTASREHVFGGTDTNGEVIGGASGRWESDAGFLRINVAARNDPGHGRLAGDDELYQESGGLAAYSHAPGEVGRERRSRTAFVDAGTGGLTLSAKWQEARLGEFYGVNHTLPPEDDNLAQRYSDTTAELRYRLAPRPDVELTARAGYIRHEAVRDDLYGNPAEYWGQPGAPDFHVSVDYAESNRYAQLDLVTRPGSHQLLASAGTSWQQMDVADMWTNLDPLTFSLGEQWYQWTYMGGELQERRIDYLALQDEWRLSDAFSLTSGVRYDDYSDVGSSVTPRLAGVWRLSQHDILKLQYGRAFRPPTFYQKSIGVNDGIDPAVIDTFEVGLIRKQAVSDLRVTLFHSRMEDLIALRLAPVPGYDNQYDVRASGAEVEWQRQFGADWRLQGQLAYLHTETNEGEPLPGSSDWLATLAVTRYLPYATELTLTGRWVNRYYREADDPRDPGDGYFMAGATVSKTFRSGLVLLAGVDNLLDIEAAEPAFMNTSQTGEGIPSYEDDLPLTDRTWWLRLSYPY